MRSVIGRSAWRKWKKRRSKKLKSARKHFKSENVKKERRSCARSKRRKN